MLAEHHAFVLGETVHVMSALSNCINMHACCLCAGVAKEDQYQYLLMQYPSAVLLEWTCRSRLPVLRGDGPKHKAKSCF